MKKFLSILTLILIGGLLYLVATDMFNLPCLFKIITLISCPACGLTRAFKCLLGGQVLNACYYNILIIPISLLICLIVIGLIYYIITGKSKIFEMLKKNIIKYYGLIIVMLLISWIYNVVTK